METKKVTELVLENVEKLLLEGRVETLKKKYPEPTWGVIDQFVEADPSPTNKFLAWALKNYVPQTIKYFKDNAGQGGYYGYDLEEVPNQSEDDGWDDVYALRRQVVTSFNHNKIKEIGDNLDHFMRNPSKYEIKDINQFKSGREFEDAVEIAKQKLSRKEQKETGVDKVFENEEFILLMPKTHKASCRYGSNTRWCVTMRGHSGYFENYFGQGPIFFLIDKRRTPSSYSPSYMREAPDYWKVAIHYRPFRGGLYGDGTTALNYARSLSKEEFLDGANIGNARIDYWNVQDANVKENVVKKYLGGPGRGQTQRSEAILTPLKAAMEGYTKKVMGDYYDSLENNSDLLDELKELKEKINKLNNESDSLYYKRNRLSDVLDRLRYFDDRLNPEGGEDDDYIEWVSEQRSKGGEFYDKLNEKLNTIQDEIEELKAKASDIKEKLDDKKLVFYDKERNVSV
jgi:FtsZ-binding cell division protein ZapB